MAKKYYGRRKVEMLKMRNETNLQVTFSKRRSGLFKKASELCTLCDARVALVVFSPSGKVFSFGHPSVEVLFDRLTRRSQNSIPSHSHSTEVERNTNSDLQVLNKILAQVLVEKEKEKETNKKYKIIKKERLKNNSENWYKNPPEELSLTQAIHMKHVAEDLKEKIDNLRSEFQLRIIPHQNYYVTSSSNVVLVPGAVHRGDNYTTHNLFDQNRRLVTSGFSYDPSMTTPSQWLLFGYNHDNNNISERIVPDSAVNRPPWYNHIKLDPKSEV